MSNDADSGVRGRKAFLGSIQVGSLKMSKILNGREEEKGIACRKSNVSQDKGWKCSGLQGTGCCLVRRKGQFKERSIINLRQG